MRMQFLAKYRETGLLIMRLGLGVLFIILTGPVLLAGPSHWANFGSGIRALLIIAVEPPQMALGAVLSLSDTDYYPVYQICGRMFDIPALCDQHYGGLIIWLPGTLLSLLAIIIVLINMRRNEEGGAYEDA